MGALVGQRAGFFSDWLGAGPWLKGLGHYTMLVRRAKAGLRGVALAVLVMFYCPSFLGVGSAGGLHQQAVAFQPHHAEGAGLCRMLAQ